MQAGDEARRLTPVPETDEIRVNWAEGSIELPEQTVEKVAQLAEASRPGSPARAGTELSGGTGPLNSNPPTRAATGFSGGTGNSANNPPTLNFRDEHGNQFTATPDGNGDWKVSEIFSRPAALARQNRTEITTAIKCVAFALVAGGEALKAAGQETYGKGLKITGNALMGAAQFSDAGHYGHSALVTAREEGLREAFADGRKAVLGFVGGAAAAVSAAVDGGDNAIANSITAGLGGFAAVSTGPTRVEQKQTEEEKRKHFYDHDSQVEAQSHLDRPLPLPRNYTGFSGSNPESTIRSGAPSLHQVPQGVPMRPTLPSNNSQGSTAQSVRDMLPQQFVQRRDTQNSGASTTENPTARPPAAVLPASQAKSGRKMGPG
ncbi:hypothetical protein [Streptomyces axinellae]|uniref:Uncharacterized protein n=1 Tax=Streptomyces axinellae TaxID=552788 RepID=A0ABP6CUQ7_9ACTN